MAGVNGWYSANWRTPGGIAAAGANALPTNGRKTMSSGVLLAASGVPETRPMATASQVRAKVSSRSSPAAASQAGRPARGRKPMTTATAITEAVLATVVSMLLMTCAARLQTRAIGMVRNRSTMPSVMSTHTATAVAMLPAARSMLALDALVAVTLMTARTGKPVPAWERLIELCRMRMPAAPR
jgi:hypothetical protein